MIVVVPKGGEQETVDEGSNQCLVSEAFVAVPGMGSIARRTAWPEQRARVHSSVAPSLVTYALENVRVNLCTRHSTGSDITMSET